MGYFRKAVGGVTWIGMSRGVVRALTFVKLAILARILSPDQFGLFGIAGLILSFLETITETGINVFLMQGEGELEDYIDSAWFVSIARGVMMSLLIFLLSPGIARFFNAPESESLIRLISLVPLIRGFINPAEVLYKKDLKFKQEFGFRTTIVLVEAAVAVILTLLLRDPSSLVWSMITSGLAELILSFVLFSQKPKPGIDTEKVKHIVKRGKWVTISQFSFYAYSEGDDVVVGKMLGAAPLGIYQVAYKISTLPLTEIGNIIHQVTLPIYVKISGDKDRLKQAYIKVAMTVFLAVLPAGMIFYFFPREIIELVLGSQWLEAANVLKILALFGVARAVAFTSQSLFLSLKKQEYTAVINLLSFLFMIGTIFPLASAYGIVGAAYAAFIGFLITVPVVLFLLKKVLEDNYEVDKRAFR